MKDEIFHYSVDHEMLPESLETRLVRTTSLVQQNVNTSKTPPHNIYVERYQNATNAMRGRISKNANDVPIGTIQECRAITQHKLQLKLNKTSTPQTRPHTTSTWRNTKTPQMLCKGAFQEMQMMFQ